MDLNQNQNENQTPTANPTPSVPASPEPKSSMKPVVAVVVFALIIIGGFLLLWKFVLKSGPNQNQPLTKNNMENNLQTTLAGVHEKFLESIKNNDFATYKALLDPEGLIVKSSPEQSTERALSLEEDFKYVHEDFTTEELPDAENQLNPNYKEG